jgi:hypothetical protein
VGAKNAVQRVWVRLDSPAAMFTANTNMLEPGARLQAGIEEVLLDLRSRRPSRAVSVTVLLPASQIEETTTGQLRAAVQRYCQLRLRETDLSRRVVVRDGVAAFGIGVLLFLVGLYLSVSLTDNTVPEALRELLGNGVFLVIAWVGLWYPLDTLIFTGQPLAREHRALRALAQGELQVAADQGEPWVSGGG